MTIAVGGDFSVGNQQRENPEGVATRPALGQQQRVGRASEPSPVVRRPEYESSPRLPLDGVRGRSRNHTSKPRGRAIKSRQALDQPSNMHAEGIKQARCPGRLRRTHPEKGNKNLPLPKRISQKSQIDHAQENSK